MIDKILAGTTTPEDIEAARAYSAEDRKKLLSRLMGALNGEFEEAVLLNNAIEDVATALKQARPVFAAGLGVDQALGFIIKMVSDSMADLEEAGEADSEEYEKQELVKDMFESLTEACENAGTTLGEEAFETVHLEYRGECAKLETLKAKAEGEIANSLTFVKDCYGEGNELASFLKGFDNSLIAARFLGLFGSPSFFSYKHVAAPGEVYEADSDKEED